MELRSRRKLLQTGVAAALLAASGLPVSARSGGGRLRVGLSEALPDFTVDLKSSPSIFGAVAGQGAVYDTLTEVSADGALKGELAQSWVPSDEAAVWTFTLRDDVRFHDGVPLTAGTVADVFTRYRETCDQASILSTVSSVRELPGNRVRFALTGSNPDFPWFLSDAGLVVARPSASRDEPPIGTGLYRFVDRCRDGRVLARRVSHHYKDGHAGWFDELELLALPDERARMEALLSGRIDVTHDLLPETLDRLSRDPRFEIGMMPDARYLAFECRGAQGAELKASLSAVVSRDELVTGALGSLGRAAQDHPFPRAALTAPTKRNVAPLPQEVAVAVVPGLGAVGARVVWVFSKQLIAAGTRVRLAESLEEADIVVRRLPVRPLEDWAWLDWARLESDGSKLTQALCDARGSFDPQTRTAAFMRVAVLAAETSSIFVPCYLNNVVAFTRNVTSSGRLGADLDLDGARIAERWWRA